MVGTAAVKILTGRDWSCYHTHWKGLKLVWYSLDGTEAVNSTHRKELKLFQYLLEGTEAVTILTGMDW